MINISDSARDRLLHIMQQEKEDKNFVRVGVESGGCSGLSYKLDFDNAKNDDDELIKDNEIQLLINKKSFLYLVGTTLEFSDGLNGKGFVFNNPNASRTCGCGESFSL
ncbi:iron-sulfur cluster assembly accessory protein [Flavobacteriales bacterium]|jgi:iron-sulfur cluster assembly protein|nr:iron-sulfur cluster assembly accessory protein [Flavobacteriales bacterium]|tara:strand:+ start:353 stop:676 length:324 start_codon:yes stop_codon:yes gene_type:complete